jgi:hypothetical protein
VLAGLQATLVTAAAVLPSHHTGNSPVVPEPFGVQLKAFNSTPENLDLIKGLGLRWVRKGFICEGIEKEKGVYNFIETDKFVSECKARGISIIGCIAFSNRLYGHPKDEPARTAYANFAAALAARYPGTNIVWEIWNEPNTLTFWGKHGKKGNTEPYAGEYVSLVKAVAPAIRKASPDAVILGGSVSGLWSESMKWMGFCFQQGILQSGITGWSVHPYAFKCPEDQLDAYAAMHQQMVAAGGPADLVLMNTERGYPLGKAEGFAGGDPALSEEYQARHIVRQYLCDMAYGVAVTSWYEWSGREGFSLHRPGKPGPAFHAVKVLIDELRGYHLDKQVGLPEGRDYLLRFVNPTGSVKLVTWTAQPSGQTPDKVVPHSVDIPVGSAKPVQVITMYGEISAVPAEFGSITLKLTGAPQYINVRP